MKRVDLSAAAAFQVVKDREAWLTNTQPLPWAGLLVSEQTRQFYAYRDIADRWLPHLFGTFRTAMEEHLPLSLLSDWDIVQAKLSNFKVLILAGAATLTWNESSILDDAKLKELVPHRSATFKGPQVLVSEPMSDDVIARMTPVGWKNAPIPAAIARTFGTGRVVFLPAWLGTCLTRSYNGSRAD